ncbi:MAG: nitrous oxide-stimulated promoter family protein [Candidatus Thiodiazotropha sp. (ex Troendleina suluensis)]|nr:nitrous oxide-stimulated promoter family protein [Candidatus Thiodiazotropha sp. (ex Troendleina suluensis)]MCU7947314.1 nitrous oxide-stimulated promoter family protein [Candidatus Thiodiazotropha sp. (ex Cardiolucina cf. quadrata)]
MSKNRIKREQQTIAAMMVIFCTDHHHTNGVLCGECSQLLDYARRRLDTCPFQEEKPACNHCTVHCYSKDMRERVQQVMRYAGPRMMLRHPILSFYHLLDKFREVPELSKPKK